MNYFKNRSSNQNTGSSYSFNSSFGSFAEKFSFNNNRLIGKSTFTQYFGESSFGDIDNGGLS